MPLTRDASVTELFLELVAVPSPSRRERVVGELIRGWLAGHGVAAQFDDAGAVNGSDAGNLVATVPGAPDAPDYLFVAHIDTVESGTPAITPHIGDDGVIRSDGETILGADNKAAVAAVMRGAPRPRSYPKRSVPRSTPPSPAVRRAAGWAPACLRPSCWSAWTAPSRWTAPARRHRRRSRARPDVVRVWGHGRAAHAAANPEAGVSAITVAAEIVTALPLGRRPGGGSVNVAAIVGGSIFHRLTPEALAAGGVESALHGALTNSIPDRALVRGEVRGYSVEEIEDTVAAIEHTIARICEAHGARYDWTRDRDRERMVPPFPHAQHSRRGRSSRRRRRDPGAGARSGGAPGHAGGELSGGGH